MSREYDSYLNQHIENVRKGFNWIVENLPNLIQKESIPNLELHIINHDDSKWTHDECDAYNAYFYGRNRSYKVVQEFNMAWLHHIHHNPHHWQYWILINDNPNEGEIIMDMPFKYMIEMICDWWAFSWKKGDLTEIFGWYEEHKDYIKLSSVTRNKVEKILGLMQKKLEELGQ